MQVNERARMREGGADWLFRAVLAGLIATMLMTVGLAVAYLVATVLGSESPNAPVLARWLGGLTHNAVTLQAETALPIAVLLHVIAGIGWAVVYAGVVEPRLSGPGWRRGLVFAPAPGILSLLVFLPALGGGIFGLGLGAGPLPVVGNLVLHLVYGATLGGFYARESAHLLVEPGETERSDEVWTMLQVEHATAIGIIVGLVVGGLGGWLSAGAFAPGQPAVLAALLGMLLGSAGGAFVGSFSRLDARRP